MTYVASASTISCPSISPHAGIRFERPVCAPPSAMILAIWSLLSALNKDQIAKIIAEGGAHTGRSNLMPAWGEMLGQEMVDALATYVMTLSAAHPAIPGETLRSEEHTSE